MAKKKVTSIIVDSAKTSKEEKTEKEPDKKVLEDIVLGEDFEMKESEKSLPIVAPSHNLEKLDPLKQYIKEIARYGLLTLEEETALAKKLLETGDIKVAKELVQANLRLVVKIAMQYKHAYTNVLDLIQEGNIGLMKAVSKFDPAKGAKLSYYASWWIKSYILKFILDNFRLVRIGTTADQKKLFFNLLKEKEKLERLGIKPDLKLIAQNLDVSEKSVALMEHALQPGSGDVSIDRPLFSDSSKSLVDIISDEDEDHIDDKLAKDQELEILKENLTSFVEDLRPRDQEIFKKRLLSEVPLSLQAIADDYGVSRERIRQIEVRLIEKLRLYMSDLIR